MANNYRGVDTAAGSSGFVGVDDTIIGTGAADTATRPLSTHVYNRALGNLMYLAGGVHQVGWAPVPGNNSSLTAATGDRAFASLDWISIGLWHIPITRGLTGVRISGVYNVQSAGTTQPDLRLKVNLGSASTGELTLSNTDNAGSPAYDVFSTTLSFAQADLPFPIQESELGHLPLHVWIRSKEGDARTGTDTVSTVYGFVDGATSPFFDEGTGSNPTTDSLEVQYLYVTAGGLGNAGSGGDSFDMLGRVATASGQAMAITNTYDAGGSLTVQRYYMSYVQFRGIWVQPIYDTTSIIDVAQDDIEPSKTVSGPIVAAMLDGCKRLYERPKILSIGPNGYYDTANEGFTDAGYCEIWPYVLGDDAEKMLIEDIVLIDVDNPIIEVVLNVIAVHHRTQANTSKKRRAEGDEYGMGARSDGVAQWDFNLYVDQRDDVASASSTWASNNTSLLEASATVTRKLPLYPASHFVDDLFLRQMALMDDRDDFDAGYVYKEGSLFESDVPLMGTVNIAARLSGMSGNTAPSRVRVGVALDGGFTPIYTTSSHNSTAQLRLVVVGYTIVQRALL